MITVSTGLTSAAVTPDADKAHLDLLVCLSLQLEQLIGGLVSRVDVTTLDFHTFKQVSSLIR